MSALAASEDFDLLSIDRSEGVTAAFPFLDATTIPMGAYKAAQDFPSTAVKTVATREILICSSDLGNKDVIRILSTLLDHLPDVTLKCCLATQISRLDPERAFYYPLHAGALAV